MDTTIAFIGLGNMGRPMAKNLLKAGYQLRVYNRTRAKAEELAKEGALVADSPWQAVEPGGILITSLANDEAVESVTEAVLEHLGPNGVHISMSTISPLTARRLADCHRKFHVEYVAAPVFGRPEAAAARKLWICVSGVDKAKARADPILRVLGQGIFDFGEDPAAAHVVKLCGNMLIAAAIEALGESLTLAEKSGLDRLQVADMMGQTLFACQVYQGYGNIIAEHRYEPAGFKASLGEKDICLVLETGRASLVPLPLASLLHDRFISMLAKGRADLDWSGIARNSAEEAGISHSR